MNLDCRNTFIAVAEDCKVDAGSVPKPKKDGQHTVAEVQYRMLVEEPYRHTQEDVLFESSTLVRNASNLTKEQMTSLRIEFFSKSQACLRASPMGKTYGWGIHFDEKGRAAAFGRESAEYKRLVTDSSLDQTRAMRTKRS